MNKRQLLALAAAALALQLAGCGAMHAQNPGGTLRPVNAVPAESAERLMLKGADVVAYFTQGRYVQGQPAFASRYQDVDFHFASAEHKALFDKDPARYRRSLAATAPTASSTASPGAAMPTAG